MRAIRARKNANRTHCAAIEAGPSMDKRAVALQALRYSTGAVDQGPVETPAVPLTAAQQRAAAADAELRAWIGAVVQPSEAMYDGHGVARPSSFIKFGVKFRAQYEKVQAAAAAAATAQCFSLTPLAAHG